jgi:Protein of unknown function (DUF4232)
MRSAKTKRMRATRLAAAGAAALALALTAAACGSSNTADTSSTGPATVTRTVTVNTGTGTSTPATTTSTTSTGTTTTTTTSTPTTTTPTTTTPTTKTGATTTTSTSGGSGLASDQCVASELTPVSKGSNGAAGTIIWEIALKNTGSSACNTYGWPGAQFLDSSGTPIGKPATRTTTSMQSGSVHPTVITLQPGAEANFYIQVNDAAGGGAGCTSAAYLQIYAPNDTTAMRLGTSQQVEYCPTTTVTPLQASAG